MGESFTVQITSNLVRHLAGDGKKVEEKTRKPKPVISREAQHSDTLPPTPEQKPANADPAVIPCFDEKDTCSKCHNENTKDPFKFTNLVEGFAESRRKFRQQVGILKDFLGQFRDK